MEMSRFDIQKTQRTPDEWSQIAFRQTTENGLQWKIAMGVIVAAVTTSATSPLTGLLVFGWTVYTAVQKAKEVQRNQVAIRDYGCVAHVLDGDDFRGYLQQVGEQGVRAELNFAQSQGYSVSDAAMDYLEGEQGIGNREQGKYLPITNHQSPITNHQSPITTNTITFDQEVPDLAKKVAEDLKNSLFIGVPGVGKDYFIANALNWVRQLHPNCTVFFIDPKDDPKETSYFDGRVDYLFRKNICEASPQEVYEWVVNCLAAYDKFDAGTGLKLLVFNELAATNRTLTNVKGALNWLLSKMVGYSSSGDSRGIKIWGVSQNAHNSGIGFDGGSKSIFTPYVIVSESQLSASEQVLKAQIIPSDKQLKSDELKAICQKSPVKRAIFHGGLNQWFPMPRLHNFSGYDRDSRSFVNPPEAPVSDALTSEERESLRGRTTQLMIDKLERTKHLNLDDFIAQELGENDRIDEVREAIIKTIFRVGHQGLIYKFKLQMERR